MLQCPRTGAVYDLKPEQTILSTIISEQSETSKYKKLIQNAIYDPASLHYIDKCPKCGVSLAVKIRVGVNEKLFKMCKNGHQL